MIALVMPKHRKYVFVTGGVMSGVGKGVSTASIGALLKARGLKVTAVKIDPYINVDPGTLNPLEHGEVFVTRDGLETDQDIGNYERFLNEDLTRKNYMTTGSVYLSVIERERALGYHGKTVEVVPHIPREVIGRIRKAADHANADVTIIEIGGTVGEYQNVLFLEACRMMKLEHPQDVAVVLVSYLPVPGNLGEMKSKPTQYAVRSLNAAGLQPDMIICRSAMPIDETRKQKISINCSVAVEDVIAAPDLESIYEVPLKFHDEQVSTRILKKLGIRNGKPNLRPWQDLNRRIKSPKKRVRIGVIGKYLSTGNFTLTDSYLSVLEAIKHAAWHLNSKPEIVWLNSEDFERRPASLAGALKKVDGVLVPGGFGTRGVEGKIMAIKYAREHKIPYLGLCYGMQLATVEVARHLLGWRDANTTEIAPKTQHAVIHLMNEQEEKMKDKDYGGSMRLGEYPCILKKGSLARKLYGADTIQERHRHRFEANPTYRCELEAAGLLVTGASPDGTLAEIVEFRGHPFFMASQFHPELTSRPLRPHPLFLGFLKASLA